MIRTMSNSQPQDVEITSSWEIEGGRNLYDALTVSPSDAECTLENVVKYETCVHLVGKTNLPCELNLRSLTNQDVQMTQIAVVSEAKIIELYGKCGEYLTTTHADFIDEFEDMTVYMAVIKLPESATDCSIKFAKLKRKGQMWMYGINVFVKKCQLPVKDDKDTSVNIENVNKILKESGHHLTDKAEKFKKFLQTFDSSKILSKPPDPQMLLKMFESAYLPQGHPFAEQAKNVSKCFTDLWPGIPLTSKAKTDSIKEETVRVTTGGDFAINNSEMLADNIKQHIDKCLEKLEERIISKVDEKLKEIENRQNIQFNLILLKLENFQESLKITQHTTS